LATAGVGATSMVRRTQAGGRLSGPSMNVD
jgi:hypothetical protein